MDSTPASLLHRLRQPNQDEAWRRFVDLYTPLVFAWARRAGLRDHDAADLVQDVFTALVQKLPAFEYDGSRSFRAWLRTVTLNKWRERQRKRTIPIAAGGGAAIDDVASPNEAEPFWETEYRQHLVGRALELMQAEFQPSTWKACWEHVVSGRKAADVAAELGISVGAVYAAKFRVLARLRQELDGLMD